MRTQDTQTTDGDDTRRSSARRAQRAPGAPRHPWGWAAIVGIVGAGVFLAVAELIALIVARNGSPVLALGSFVIDIVPQWAKEFAIATFGENDKLFLLISLGVAIVVAAAIGGILQYVRPPLGIILLAIAGAGTTVATVTRAGATPLAALPGVLGTIAGAVLLHILAARLRRWYRSAQEPSLTKDPVDGKTSDDAKNTPARLDRRGFLRVLGITSAGAIVVGVGARIANAATSSITAIRNAVNLPTPSSTVTIPEGAELDIDGVSELFTPNEDFYRVDTALTVPNVDTSTWSLTITGMVDSPVTLTFDDILAMDLREFVITLTCVSNEVGGGLVGNARWLGIPVREILAQASPQSGADMVLSRSVDGYTASTPLASLTDDGLDAILAVGMNGEPLPLEHGFPVRMVVPGLYGYVSATKWLTELKVTTFAEDEAYWTPRGYSAEAPIKLSSRIDTPRTGKAIEAGPGKVAGMAWAQSVGVEKVEVRIDDGDWQPATMSSPINDDTWVQWYIDWEPDAGTHYLSVRATDKDGTLQEEERAPIAPNGSSGWQRVLIQVR
ncbi:DMSO/TMAO reductase YedYZ molybdopterin-dependent catalytic subunit [Labedella gwakjiensis]|uniref:DMSO/TMAO reductase YedYZ molybdopterin-dependent catalytic subunit n=1 Tax=Labedella gwakjiensis TaxID=390269 RepID=A0A2P8GUS7_9MICO|nr:DMSO/TMAO reductase YedYZ molybdopterin-dependent catalytic subunit [Labedella gwakjiensis]RUQ87701.1 oxidoreductase [Labedella gwakjiensis]